MRATIHLAAVLLIAAAAAGCGKSKDDGSSAGPPAPPTTATTTTTTTTTSAAAADPAATAKQIFSQRCTPCHGPTGAGDGPASAGLIVKPRNFQDPAWQASVTDDHIIKIIQFGGAAVNKDAAMPGNPDLKDPAVLAALKDVVRGLGAQ